MSKRKIVAALRRKNITPLEVEYDRSCPTPYGYAKGYNLEFAEELEDVLYNLDSDCEFSTYMELDTLEEVLEWVETLPVLPKKEKQ